MGAISSTCGRDVLNSHMQQTTAPALQDLSVAALDLDSEARCRQDDSALDVCALEVALQEHHIALRRFVSEWIGRQELLLSKKTRRMADCHYVSSGQASSQTLTCLINDGKDPPKECVHTTNVHLAGLSPEGQSGRFMANHGHVPQQNGRGSSTPNAGVSAVPRWATDVVQGHKDMPDKDGPMPDRDMPRLDQPEDESNKDMLGLPSESSANSRGGNVGLSSLLAQSSRQPRLSTYFVDSWSETVFHCWYSLREVFRRISNMVDNHFVCPLVNRFEESRFFSIFCGLLIFLNSISMAVAADYEMNHFQQPSNEHLVTIEMVFVFLYTTEIVIRVMAQRLKFFMSAWSWFDVAIVCSGWVEITSSSSTSLTQVRLMRILKMLKVMRVLRVMRSLREVRLLLNSLMGSVKPLLWTVIIITGINFMFGICFVQSIAALRHDIWNNGGGGDGQPEPEQLEMLYSAWGSVPQAMYTLFKVSTGGVSWGEVSDPLLATTGWSTFVIFLLYIAFFMFVMTNAVTAIFVSSAEEYASKDSHNMLYDQLQAKTEYMTRVVPLYREMDCDGNGEVTKAEFSKYINDPRMIAFASSLEIDTMDLDQFFDVLSSRGEMPVDLDTFVDGCIRLRGAARSMDVYDMLIQHRALSQEVGIIRSLLERLPVTTLK